MKKIPYIIIAVWLLFTQGLNAQVDSVITRTGELGSLGDVFEFVDEAGKIVSYPRLTDAGEILYYLPLVTNDSVPASLIGSNSATAYANIVFNGWHETVTGQGFQLSTNAAFSGNVQTFQVTPDNAYEDCVAPCNDNVFSYTFTGLSPGTTYYVRAFATNASGTSYSNVLMFSTLSCLPTVTTTVNPSSVTSTSAIVLSEVVTDCGSSVASRGVCWGTATGPTLSGSHTSDGNGTGSFTSSLTGLSPNTTYYVRAYATNGLGTAYGNEVTFTTPCWIVDVSISGLTSFCAGGATTLSASGAINYTWNNGMNGSFITVSEGGTYTVTGWDQYACSGSASKTVTVHTPQHESVTVSDCGSYTWHGTVYTQSGVYTYPHTDNYGCQQVDTLHLTLTPCAVVPTVTISGGVENVTTTTATVIGNVTSDGGAAVTARGIQVSTNAYFNNYTTHASGSGTGSYTVDLTGLTPYTTYYVRAYATNAVGTGYSQTFSFTTAGYAPTLATCTVTDITLVGATFNGNVTSDNMVAVTSRGFQVSTSSYFNGYFTYTSGQGTGAFSATATDLTPHTTYYVRAYATNAVGTNYSAIVSFTTAGNVPTLSACTVTDITTTGATVGATVTSDNGLPVTVRGIQISTNVYFNNYITHSSGSGTGSYAVHLTDLSPYTTYYVRAYATNAVGTGYGEASVFMTAGNPPTLGSSSVTNITTTSATVNGNVASDNQVPVTSRGVRWSVNFNMSNSSSEYAGTGVGDFSVNLTDLAPHTTYYYQTFATNAVGTTYSEKYSFTTAGNAPTLGNSSVTDITTTSATVHGDVVSDNQVPVTSRGVRWSVNLNMSSSSYDYSGAGVGDFSVNLTNLAPYTTYYYQTFATNAVGTTYSEKYSFTTAGNPPTLGNSSVTDITTTSATVHGDVVSDNQVPVTSRGVRWSVNFNMSSSSYDYSGTGIGDFSINLTNLAPYTTYYYQTFATNAAGTTYSEKQSFTTAGNVPTLGNSSVTDITTTSATVNGNVVSDNQVPVTSRGVRWSVNFNMSSSSYDYSGTGIGDFSINLTNLAPYTTYYYQTFATNAVGTAYGEKQSFTTAGNVPTLGNSTVTDITTTSATVHGNVVSDNQVPVTSRGVRWSVNFNMSSSSYDYSGTGIGDFSINLTNLAPYTTYYYQTFATNAVGTAYGEKQSFTTARRQPTVTTTSASSLTYHSAILYGSISNPDNMTIIAQGFEWKTTGSSTYNQVNVTNNTMSYSLSGLTANTSYTYRAFVTTDSGTVYGNEMTFTTLEIVQPTAITNAASSVSDNSATLNGTIYNPDDVTITAQGFEWKTTSGGTYTQVPATGTTMSYNLMGLSDSTSYTYRAFVTTAAGTSYGNETTFITLAAGFVCGASTVKDIDNNTYHTLQLGNQCWMAENLRTTRYGDGTSITLVTSTSTGPSSTVAYRYYPSNNSNNVPTYGYLYNWSAVMRNSISSNDNPSGVQGVCPIGWHVPSSMEWGQLTNYVINIGVFQCNGNSSYVAKALASRTGWVSSTTPCAVGYDSDGNNLTGFGAMPAGYYYYSNSSGIFTSIYNIARFWSSTQRIGETTSAWTRELKTNTMTTSNSSYDKSYGHSVRCVRNETVSTSQTQPTVTTSTATNVQATTATLKGSYINPENVNIIDRGFEWKTTSGGTYMQVSATGTTMSYNLTGLTPNTSYTYRAYVTTSVGTKYGAEMTFTTLAPTQPTVTTSAATNITTTSSTLNGSISNPDNVTITAQGFEWKVTTGGTYAQVNATGDNTMAYNLTGLTANTGYTYRAFVTTASGTSYGEEVTFTTAEATPVAGQPCPGATTVTDYDGNTYNTVQIGNQCWMKENLRTKHYADGTPVPAGGSSTSYTDPYYYDYTSSNIPLAQRGYLYNWPAAMHGAASSTANPSGVQGICPNGWHLPSDAEWTTMTDYVSGQSEYTCGGDNGYIAKALASTTYWNNSTNNCAIGNTPSSNNATGFSAVPAGYCYGSSFNYAGSLDNFWSSSQYESDSYAAWYRRLGYSNAGVDRSYYNKNYGFSVRCLRDADAGNTSSVTSPNPCTVPATHPAQTDSTYQNNGFNGANYGLETETSDGKINSVTDYDGNEYPVVQIGSQCWLAENMRCTHSPLTGTYIVTPSTISNYTYTGKQARWYTGTATLNGNSVTMDSAACVAHRFGLLYNWNAAVDVYNTSYGELSVNTSSSNAVNTTFSGNRQGICPRGWHVPTDSEWNTMEAVVNGSDVSSSTGYRGSHAGKLAGGNDWNTGTNLGTPGDYTSSQRNSSGFAAVPVGNCISSFNYAGVCAVFWSSSPGEDNAIVAWNRTLIDSYAGVGRTSVSKSGGFSVRCLRDESGNTATAVILSEDFSAITDSNSYSITSSLDSYTQMVGWTGDWVFPSNGKVKLGKSAEAGFLQTPSLDLSGNNGQFVVTFDAKAWFNDADSIIVSVNGVSYTVSGLSSTEFNTFSLPIVGGTSSTVVKFQGSQETHSRFFLDNIVISQ